MAPLEPFLNIEMQCNFESTSLESVCFYSNWELCFIITIALSQVTIHNQLIRPLKPVFTTPDPIWNEIENKNERVANKTSKQCRVFSLYEFCKFSKILCK